MDELEKDLQRWGESKDPILASMICEKIYHDLIADKCTDGVMEDVMMWGREKGINDPIMQFAKLNEEVGEIGHELTRLNFRSDEMEDALGDTFVTLIILADILDYDLHDCLVEAYETIRHRKGHTQGGSFIKDVEN